MEVLGPKTDLEVPRGDGIAEWAKRQLRIAVGIIDNPAGGLLFATQTIGQVRSAMEGDGDRRWEGVLARLEQVEDAAVRRRYELARELLKEVLTAL